MGIHQYFIQDHSKAVLIAASVAGFISFLSPPHPVVAEQAIWTFGNFACYRSVRRDHLIEQITSNIKVNLINFFY